MPNVRRNGSVATPAAAPRPPPRKPVAAEATAPVGWVAQDKANSTATTVRSLETAVTSLEPKLGKINAAPLINSLGDGNATIDVPLKAGDYKVKGITVTIKPGTVAHVNVQVHNGELVPVGHGQKGTSVKIDPPLDLPLWVTGNGVELKGDSAKQKFEADLGGFFDLSFKAKPLSQLLAGGGGEAAPSTAAAAPSASHGDGGLGAIANQLVDLSKVKVDAKVTLRQSEVDIGGAKVKVDPSTTFSVKGDGQRATISGHVALDGFKLQQVGVDLASRNGGKAELSATLTQVQGGYQLDSKLSGMTLSVDKLTSVHPSAVVPGKMDRISLGPTEIHEGEMKLSTKVGLDGLGKPTVDLSFKASGTIDDAQLTVKDAKDSATASVRGQFSGNVKLGPGGTTFDAKLTGAHVDVRDLQQNVNGNQVSIERAVADGDLHFANTSGSLRVDGEAKNLDIVVDDYKGGAGGVKADLGRTTVTGDGKFSMGSGGLHAEGRMKGSATIDSASFTGGKKNGALGSSTVSGEMTKLDLGQGAPTMRLENVAADLDVRASLDLGQTSVTGGGRLKATGTVVLDAKGFSLDGKGQVSMKLDDGRVHSSTVDLAMGKGSSAELNINELSIGQATTVKLGPGSKVDAILAGGTLQVGGTTVELEKGGRAQVAVKSVDVKDGKTDLRGSVNLDAKVKAGQVSLAGLGGAGVKVHPTDVEGRVKLSIDDVHLADDRLTFKNANLSLDAKVGKYVGVSTPGQPGLGSLQEPVPVISAADVKKSTAAQLAGVTATAPSAPASPLDALKLLREGEVHASVPLQGTIHALGMDVVKFPPGSKLELSLSVHEGKIVAKDTKASLTGGAKAVGVEVLGVHVDENMLVHADVKIAGKTLSVPVPGLHVPADMAALAARAGKTKASTGTGGEKKAATDSKSAMSEIADLAHAQLDITNATFGKGTVNLPGGTLELAEGSKLSFHGTPLSGELTGSVGLDAVNLAREDVAVKGSGGRADLRLSYRREGDKAIVDGALSNLSMSTDYVVRKAADGDYVSLGAGKMSGGSVSLHAEVPVDANGLPKLSSGALIPSEASVNVPSFTGELKGARMTADGKGSVQLGKSHVEGAVAFSEDRGLTLKATVDSVDAELDDVRLNQKGRALDVDHARVKGRGGSVDLGPDKLSVDAKQLEWDATVREVDATAGKVKLKANQVHVSGEGRFTYDSKKDLKVEGRLHVDGRVAGSGAVKSVTIDRRAGVKVQR